jgi:predicted Rdx family selenoprotein
MGWSSGELEIHVDGARVYSYKDEKTIPEDSVLINRIRAKVWETRHF